MTKKFGNEKGQKTKVINYLSAKKIPLKIMKNNKNVSKDGDLNQKQLYILTNVICKHLEF